MAIRIEWKNGSPVAECDTVAEAVEMMRAASNQNGSAPTPQTTNNNHEKGRPNDPTQKPSSQVDVVTLLQGQKPQVRKLLECLHEVGTDVKAEDLATLSEIDAKAYGGLFGALSKYAKKANIPLDEIYTTSVRFDGPRRERWYAPGKLLKEVGAKAFEAK